MMKLTLSMFMITLTMMMYFLNHPLSMGMFILMQTLLTCLLSGMLIKTYWFSYILFLTFLGGLLVLFIYVSSIASNEMFSSSYQMKFIFMIILTMLLLFQYMYMKNLNWMNLNNNSEMENFSNYFFFNNENKMNLNKLYNNNSSMLMLLLIIYLFITLIAVVKITNIFYGPLRSSFN